MPTEMELTLEQTQQGVSYEVSKPGSIHKLSETLMVLYDIEDWILKDNGEDFCYSYTERLSRSDEVLKLKNFKKDAALKLSKSTNQEWYGHRENVVRAFMNVPIFVGNFSVVTDFVVVGNMDAYRDKDMRDVIIGMPFCRASCVEARQFDGFITIHDGNDNVTYQMARSYPRFKHLTNAQCNKIWPLLKVSARDKLEGISHAYKKLKGFYKGVLNLGPEYIRDAKTVEWLC
ncbi:hypothetical protein Tco_0730788 [Tanacetum coccineum]